MATEPEPFVFLSAVGAHVGDELAVVIDGGALTLRGTLQSFNPTFVPLRLTVATPVIPMGTVMFVFPDEIAAIGKVKRELAYRHRGGPRRSDEANAFPNWPASVPG